VLVDPWHDLVYHALSHLRISPADASGLYGEAHVQWSDRLFRGQPADAAAPRTLTADAELLASLYDASPAGYLLHAWPTLWDDVAGFVADIGTDLADVAWPTEARGRLVRGMLAHTAEGLAELFRTALWAELRNGFEAGWRREIAPRSEAYRPEFAEQVGRIAEALPGLREITWVLSLPLRRHGRVLHAADGEATVVVGVADEELGVGPMEPVLQGCHEYFVYRAEADGEDGPLAATAPGGEGHARFQAVENAALRAGAGFFGEGPWRGPYLGWLGRLFPETPPERTLARLAAGEDVLGGPADQGASGAATGT
jgi:hypothetical protein